MTTSIEFINSGITGQTFKEIVEKFGKSYNALAQDDAIMTNYALAFAWFREREHQPVPTAYESAMKLTVSEIVALFEDGSKPEVKAAADFVSPPLTTQP